MSFICLLKGIVLTCLYELMAYLWHSTDMRKALSELGFVNREALIVVPHHSVDGSYKGQSSSSRERASTAAGDSDPSGDNGGGLFGYVKRILSALNPFSYFGSSSGPSSSESASSNSMWQYRESIALLFIYSILFAVGQSHSIFWKLSCLSPTLVFVHSDTLTLLMRESP